MKCYVINLAQDVDRLSAFLADWTAPFPFEVVAALDGSTLVHGLPPRWKHSRGAYGLFVTYAWIFVEALCDRRAAPFAVFEDDAQLAPGWVAQAEAAIAEAPDGWRSINLGPEIEVPGFELAPTVVGAHLARMPHGWRTHAVIYNPQAATKMINAMEANPIPVDQVWCDLMLKGSRDFYCTRSFLAGTRPGRSRITGIEWDKPFVGPFGLGGAQHRSLGGAQSIA